MDTEIVFRSVAFFPHIFILRYFWNKGKFSEKFNIQPYMCHPLKYQETVH